MLIEKAVSMGKEVVQMSWQRDPESMALLSLHTDSGSSKQLGFPLNVFEDLDAWYDRMVPGDVGKELLLLHEVYRTGKGTIRYRILSHDGQEWEVTETVEVIFREGTAKKVLSGQWVFKRI